MAPSLLPSIDLNTYAQSTKGLKPEALAYIGSVFAAIKPNDVDNTLTHLQSTVGQFSTNLEVSPDTSVDDIVALLDAGAATVFVTEQQLSQLKGVDNIDVSRIGLLILETFPGDGVVPSILLKNPEQDFAPVAKWLGSQGQDARVYLPTTQASTVESVISVVRTTKGAVTPIIPSESLTVETSAGEGLFPVADLLLANVSSDRPDGLFTTLVTDERGVALGLVYSSKESVAESLRSGRGVYQSRKRGLWYKGESSGDIQELITLKIDCDQDCLQFVVRQKGRGCHPRSRSISLFPH